MGKLAHIDIGGSLSKVEWEADTTHKIGGVANLNIVRTATLVVAASNASAASKAQADYVCNGVNDHLVIQAAIDALPANGGKVLLLEGTYNIAGTITLAAGLQLEGQGIDATRLIVVSGTNQNILVYEPGAFSYFLSFANFTLRGQDTGGNTLGSGIKLNANVFDVRFTNIFVYHFPKQGLDLATGWGYYFYGCVIEYNGNNAGYGVQLFGGNAAFVNCKFLQNRVGAYLLDATKVQFEGCVFGSSGSYGILVDRTTYITFTNCLFDSNVSTGLYFTRTSHSCIVTACTLISNARGIEESGATGGLNSGRANQYYNNLFYNNATANMALVPSWGSLYAVNHSDIFMDVLAVSANHVVAAQALGADPTVCAIAAQPDVPRTLSWAITHPTLTAFTLTFVGVNARGRTVSEVYNEPSWTGETNNAFATVTSITMSAMTGETGADTIDVGITDILGLSNVIYATADVYKIKKNTANVAVAGAQVNTTYDTYDMAVIGLAVNDDFTIWFRSNLNILS